MSTDLATLSLRIESLETVVAGKRLDTLSAKGTKAAASMGVMSKAAKALGGVLAGLFAFRALGGMFANISKTASKFEASISELAAITGAAGKNLEYLTAKSKEFGRTTTLSASQAAEGFKLVASAKPDLLENAEALAKVTENAIALAEATGSTLPEAAETLGSALNQFGAGAEEADRFINVLAAGAQRGASMVRDTAEALRFAGTVAASVGASFEVTNAAIQQLSTVGIKGSEAGTALRNIFLKLEGQMSQQFKPSVVGFTQALRNLRDAEEGQIDTLKLFGLRSVVAANNLIAQADNVEILEKKITKTSTAFEQQATKVDNLEGSMKQLASATEGLTIRLGEGMEPAQRASVDSLTKAANAFTTYLGRVEESDRATSKWGFVVQATVKILFAWYIEFLDLIDLIKKFGEHISITGQMIMVSFRDMGDAASSFGRSIVALAQLDFDMVDRIAAARETAKLQAEEELKLLSERRVVVNLSRIAQRAEAEAQIELFNSRVEFGAVQTDLENNSIERAQVSLELTKEQIAAEAARAQAAEDALTADSQAGIEDVADKYATDIEAAEQNAAEQKAILAGITAFTVEQEELKAETIRRIDQELTDLKSEAFEKIADQAAKETEVELKAIQDRQDVITEFKIMAAETETEREQIRFEERLELIEEQAEEEAIAKSLLDAAIEQASAEHEKKLTDIKARELKARKRLEDIAAKGSVANQFGYMAQLTSGVAQHSKKMFKINKIAAMAQAAMNIPRAASDAFAAAGNPIVGAIFAALAIAAEVAQLNAIRSTTFEGGGGGTTPSAAGSMPTINGTPVSSRGQNETTGDFLNPPSADDDEIGGRTQIVVTGNVGFTPDIIDEIADGIREATGDRDVVLFDENSRQAQDVVRAT